MATQILLEIENELKRIHSQKKRFDLASLPKTHFNYTSLEFYFYFRIPKVLRKLRPDLMIKRGIHSILHESFRIRAIGPTLEKWFRIIKPIKKPILAKGKRPELSSPEGQFKKRIVVATPALVHHDAVSTDVELIESLLAQNGFETYIFCDHTDKYYADSSISKIEALSILNDPQSVLIYHHSSFWPHANELFQAAKGTIIFRYHNITPAEFFKYNRKQQGQIAQGREQARQLISSGKITRFINDSRYNSLELVPLGARPDLLFEAAPLHRMDDFLKREGSTEVESELRASPRFKLLFVSRFMPHKGQDDLLKIVRRYVEIYGPEIELHLIGKFEVLSYVQTVYGLVEKLGLDSLVKIHLNLSFPELVAYFKNCDTFIIMSKHEGFGVPIIEAQMQGKPIIALDRAAVAETGGDGLIKNNNLDIDWFCAAIRTIKTNQDLRQDLSKASLENSKRFALSQLKENFMAIFSEAISGSQ